MELHGWTMELPVCFVNVALHVGAMTAVVGSLALWDGCEGVLSNSLIPLLHPRVT